MLFRNTLFLPPVMTATPTQCGLFARNRVPLPSGCRLRQGSCSLQRRVRATTWLNAITKRGPVLVRVGSMEYQARRTVTLPSGANAGLLETAPSVRRSQSKKMPRVPHMLR